MEIDKKLLQYSPYLCYAGKTLEKILPNERIANKRLEVLYKFNSNGFRTHEFNYGEDCCIALGCSYTMGTAMPIELVWPSKLEEHLGMKIYNLGIGGGSRDLCVRLAMGWVDVLKPKKVFCLWPFPKRFELITSDKEQLTQSYRSYTKFEFAKFPERNPFIEQYFNDDNNSEFNSMKNKLMLDHICKENNTELYHMDVNINNLNENAVTFGRDRRHKGEDYQNPITDLFIDLL